MSLPMVPAYEQDPLATVGVSLSCCAAGMEWRANMHAHVGGVGLCGCACIPACMYVCICMGARTGVCLYVWAYVHACLGVFMHE